MTKRPDFSEDEFEYDHLFIDALEEYADALEERIEELEARVEFLESDGPLLEGFLE